MSEPHTYAATFGIRHLASWLGPLPGRTRAQSPEPRAQHTQMQPGWPFGGILRRHRLMSITQYPARSPQIHHHRSTQPNTPVTGHPRPVSLARNGRTAQPNSNGPTETQAAVRRAWLQIGPPNHHNRAASQSRQWRAGIVHNQASMTRSCPMPYPCRSLRGRAPPLLCTNMKNEGTPIPCIGVDY